LNAEKPISDGLFEIADLEKYLKERVKVDGRTNNLGEVVAIARGFPSSDVPLFLNLADSIALESTTLVYCLHSFDHVIQLRF
jgi:hypothetical protein